MSGLAVAKSPVSSADGAHVRPPRRVRVWLLAAAISCSITITNQVWVGGLTIYSSDTALARERMHEIILANRLPDGVETWDSIGANSFNVRRLTVWTAEQVHRLTGQSLARSYWVIETAALLACCLLLFALLQSYAGGGYAFGGLLYFGSVLPMTYLFHYFHPWDKPCLAAWLAALLCTYHRKWLYLAAVLVVGMFIKYDIIVFPLFVFFAEFRRSGWRHSTRLAGALLALTVSAYIFLRWSIPGGFEPRPVLSLVLLNLLGMREHLLSYPPLLALGVPAFLAVIGYSRADDFGRAGVLLGTVLVGIWFLQVYFVEFRTETPLLALLLPAAFYGVRRTIDSESSAAR